MSPTDPALLAVALAVVLAVTTRPRRPPRRPRRSDTADPGDVSAGRGPADDGSRRRHRSSARGPDGAALVAAWCEALARAVRGGSSLTTALSTTAPPAGDARIVLRATRDLERTGRFALPPDRCPADLALASAVISAVLTHGGPAAEPLDRAADVLRGRAAERADRRVQSAQARLSAQVMSILPIAMLLVLATTSSSVRMVLATPIGIGSIVLGGVVNCIGWAWMLGVIRRAER